MKRSSGVLMHITSLPGAYGIGTLGKEARRFADFCHNAGLKWWQILPIGPTGYGESPYQSDSVFAGNQNLIDLEQLVEEGLLHKTECEEYTWCDLDKNGREILDSVSFSKVKFAKQKLLRLAFSRAREGKIWGKVEDFCREQENWLSDYALYLAVKEEQGGKPWQQWDEEIRDRKESAMKGYRKKLKTEIEYYSFVQYLFRTQWESLKQYCNRKGVFLIGDIPIYVAADSCDTWKNRNLFECTADGTLLRVAGCPPDYFSKTGQLWGNPLYHWDRMEKDGFSWWIERIKAMSQFFDLTRIDHFRGFAGYYAIDAKETTAKHGVWEKGPGEKLFQALKQALPNLALIAEDLGFITPDVEKLRDDFGFPGMKILQFAFSTKEESSYLPHNCPKRAIMYTGTHDNDTSLGWAEELKDEEWDMVKNYLGICDRKDAAKAMVRAAFVSRCELAIAPMQDFLQLPTSARMNLPSTVGTNWKWRMLPDAVDQNLTKWIYDLNKASWRLPIYRKNVRAKLADTHKQTEKER